MTIRALRGSDASTITELSRLTGLSRPAVEDVVADLVAQGWAEMIGPVAIAMGRPARRYRFRADARHVLGIDVGAHKVLALLADLDGTVLAQAKVTVDPQTPTQQRLAQIDTVIADCLSTAGRHSDDLSAVGVATTGMVNEQGVVTLATGIPGWAGVDLGRYVRESVNCPVLVENDTKLAALAEQWRGAAQGADDVVYVLAGMRTSASLIIGGRLHRGYSGVAGEIGMLPEARWGAAQDKLLRFPGARADLPADERARRVFDAARDGDSAAQRAVRDYARELAVGTAALVLTLDPELVVLGGGYSRAGEVLLEPLRLELAQRCLRTPQVVNSILGGEAPALGAVRLGLDAAEEEAFAPEPVTLRPEVSVVSGG